MRTTLMLLLVTSACGATTGGSAAGDAKASAAKTGDAKVGDVKAGVEDATAKTLAEAKSALASIDAAQRPLLAAAALAEAEAGRLPPDLISAFGELQSVPPEMRGLVAMKAVASPAVLAPLQELCDGKAPEVLSSVAQVAPTEKLQLVWDGCKLERVGLVARSEAEGADIGQLVLAHVAHRLLAGKGGPSADETALLRAFVIGSASAR